MNQPENDIEFQSYAVSRNRKREFIIRSVGIVITSFIFTFFNLVYLSGKHGFWIAFAISLVRTTLIWNGSMYIIAFSMRIFSMFRETLKLIVFEIVTLSVFVILVEVGEIYVVEKWLNLSLSQSDRVSLIVIALLITFMISAIYASVAFFGQWKENLLRSQVLEKSNLEARYNTLRNQINPHFLFNSLNTLLMMVNDKPVAVKYVESISEIMRYMLQMRDKDAVLLRDELKIAEDYVFVQKSRFGDKLLVDFDVNERFYHYAVPPLALQMLLENAIKHNVISKEDPLKVKIFVEGHDYLVVENTFSPKIEKEPSTGIGLENIRNRYLYLSGKKIVISRLENKFVVKLPLFEKTM